MTCNENNNISLEGKTILITGATSGIGLASALSLTQKGGFVIGVGRNNDRNEKAKEEILSKIPNGKIEYLLADLASPIQVRELAKAIKNLLENSGKRALDVLVNNAGIYLEQKQINQGGIEKTFAVNHLAPFLLSYELLPLLKKSENGRILTVTSYSHRTTPMILSRLSNPRPYIGLLAYKRSKLCNVLFTYEFNRKMDGEMLAFAVDPGLVNTSIASKGSDGISDWVWRFRRKQGSGADVPAKTIAYLSGVEKIDTSQGYYFKNCAPLKPSLQSRDESLAQGLWHLSCELMNIEWNNS